MKIKRFFASEMREAIRQVKDELGPDAVILSNNKVDGGIELVAAIDYDEEVVQRHAESQRQQKTASSTRQGFNSDSTTGLQNKKKRSVFAKVRKQNNSARLEDAIEDDVISFTGKHAGKQSQAPKAVHSAASGEADFASLLQQSSQNSSAKASTNTSAYSTPSLHDRKQPFISEFGIDDNEQQDAGDDGYPFDYESLVKDKQKRSPGERAENGGDWDMESFFDNSPKPGRANGTNRKNQTKTGSNNKVEWVQDPALTSMQEEIKSLRGILENQLSGLAWGDFARRHPHRAELLSRLFRLGIKSSLSEKIVKQLKNSDSLEDSWRNLLNIIARNIPTVSTDLIDEGGIIALVGPTGVGKTTNIAKLAARFTLKYGAKDLALVTTDSYRIGAHEQLKTYGRILGVPVYIAGDENELKQVLSRLDDKKLVLIDTAGMSHRDLRLAQQLSMLRRSHNNMKILAVLSAASQTMVMDEVIKTFNAKELDGCIASKVDESTSIGGIISILIENQLHLNYISDGQKVPEDIHQANTKAFLKQALEMVRQHPVQVKADELAMSYTAGGLAHAFG